jgi:hypothetical protein
MSDQTSTELREEVRFRYAAAAHAVLEPEAGAAVSCCGVGVGGGYGLPGGGILEPAGRSMPRERCCIRLLC